MSENLYQQYYYSALQTFSLLSYFNKRMLLFGDVFERYLVIESEMTNRHLTVSVLP